MGSFAWDSLTFNEAEFRKSLFRDYDDSQLSRAIADAIVKLGGSFARHRTEQGVTADLRRTLVYDAASNQWYVGDDNDNKKFEEFRKVVDRDSLELVARVAGVTEPRFAISSYWLPFDSCARISAEDTERIKELYAAIAGRPLGSPANISLIPDGIPGLYSVKLD